MLFHAKFGEEDDKVGVDDEDYTNIEDLPV